MRAPYGPARGTCRGIVHCGRAYCSKLQCLPEPRVRTEERVGEFVVGVVPQCLLYAKRRSCAGGIIHPRRHRTCAGSSSGAAPGGGGGGGRCAIVRWNRRSIASRRVFHSGLGAQFTTPRRVLYAAPDRRSASARSRNVLDGFVRRRTGPRLAPFPLPPSPALLPAGLRSSVHPRTAPWRPGAFSGMAGWILAIRISGERLAHLPL